MFQWSSSTEFSYMHPQGRVRQGNTREAKNKTCELEVDKRLKRFHSPLENHSSSSASPKVESREMKEGKCRREVSTGSWANKQESREEKKNIGNTKEEWGRRPQIS